MLFVFQPQLQVALLAGFEYQAGSLARVGAAPPGRPASQCEASTVPTGATCTLLVVLIPSTVHVLDLLRDILAVFEYR